MKGFNRIHVIILLLSSESHECHSVVNVNNTPNLSSSVFKYNPECFHMDAKEGSVFLEATSRVLQFVPMPTTFLILNMLCKGARVHRLPYRFDRVSFSNPIYSFLLLQCLCNLLSFSATVSNYPLFSI